MSTREAIQKLGTRWAPLVATSRSGKMLNVCLVCGRTSPFGDKKCPAPAHVPSYWLSGESSCVTDCAEYEYGSRRRAALH